MECDFQTSDVEMIPVHIANDHLNGTTDKKNKDSKKASTPGHGKRALVDDHGEEDFGWQQQPRIKKRKKNKVDKEMSLLLRYTQDPAIKSNLAKPSTTIVRTPDEVDRGHSPATSLPTNVEEEDIANEELLLNEITNHKATNCDHVGEFVLKPLR